MADARMKAVWGQLADLTSRTNYAVDIVRNMREPLGFGDTIEVPSIANLTVTSSGATGASPQSISTSVLSLVANLQPAIFAALPQVDVYQLMDGSWASQVAADSIVQLKNYLDEQFLRNYLAITLCYDTSATYHNNVAGDSLVDDDILTTKAALLANDGTRQENLALFVSPYGEGSIANISGFIPNVNLATSQNQSFNLGLPLIGSVYGIPVYTTNSVQRSLTAATTAVSVTSNVATATVASGHGFVPGMVISTTGHTTNATNVAITSVTATTIVYPLTACNGALADGVGTITGNSSMNIMLDRSHVFVAQQRMPMLRMVDDYDSTDTALQCSAIWGRIGRAGRARVLHSPASAV